LPVSTNHQAFIEKYDKTYSFYHDDSLPGGGNHKIAIRFAELHYENDGSIVQLNVPTPSLNIK
jgi:hypothetical protein